METISILKLMERISTHVDGIEAIAKQDMLSTKDHEIIANCILEIREDLEVIEGKLK